MNSLRLYSLCTILCLFGCVGLEGNEPISSLDNPPTENSTNNPNPTVSLDLENLQYAHEAIGSEEEPLDICSWIGNPLDEGSKLIQLTSVTPQTPTCDNPGPYGSLVYVDLGYQEIYNVSSPGSATTTGTLRHLGNNFSHKYPEPGDFMFVTFFNYDGLDIIERRIFLITDSTYQPGPESPVLPTTASELAASYTQHLAEFSALCPDIASFDYPSKDDIMQGVINELGACE